jgi:hypothetical protein
MSKRMGASFCAEVLGVPLALGEVCQVEQTVAAALDPAVHEARADVQQQDVNSVAGSRFVENVLTVVASGRQQEWNVLAYLTHCCQALSAGTPPPSLLSRTAS